ncbi:MAG: nucleotidyltransferase family protein [Synergistaceae bacterium]|nr:nucleotidyltransferase family protein [Synergistaceae bacterium]
MHTPVAGIIAEYNPFHQGHLHHITETRKLTGAEAAVVVLSSDFVQRGEPAMLDKWSRAEIVLRSGADLVLELPALFSSHNAGVFANAAVDIIGATGTITHLAFGVENPEWQTDEILDILIDEPEPFKANIKEFLRGGLSFVEARSLALDKLIPGTAEKLKGSNNILALSYMKRIAQKKYDIRPVPILRSGSDHNSKIITDCSSAAAIRELFVDGKNEEALAELPRASREVVSRELLRGHCCITHDKYWNLLRASLLRADAETLSRFAEISEGIENKLRASALTASSLIEWTRMCSSKRYPHGRIRRHGAHILLGFDHWTNRACQRIGPAYIRVLGMNAVGQKLLRRMKYNSSLPIITRCGATSKISEYATEIMRYELLACELWEQTAGRGIFGEEHKKKPIILE